MKNVYVIKISILLQFGDDILALLCSDVSIKSFPIMSQFQLRTETNYSEKEELRVCKVSRCCWLTLPFVTHLCTNLYPNLTHCFE